MTKYSRVTAYDLFLSCPDDQVVRLEFLRKEIEAGDWLKASRTLRAAASEGNSEWHKAAKALSERYETKAKNKE